MFGKKFGDLASIYLSLHKVTKGLCEEPGGGDRGRTAAHTLINTSCGLINTSCGLINTSCGLIDTSCGVIETSHITYTQVRGGKREIRGKNRQMREGGSERKWRAAGPGSWR